MGCAAQACYRGHVIRRNVALIRMAVMMEVARNRAVRMVQRRWWRARPGRLMWHLRRKNLMARARREGLLLGLWNKCARSVQTGYRAYRARVLFMRMFAQRDIARVWRGHRARVRCREIRRALRLAAISRRAAYYWAWAVRATALGIRARMDAAGARIQALARGVAARVRYIELCRLRDNARIIQRMWLTWRKNQLWESLKLARHRLIGNEFKRLEKPTEILDEVLRRATALFNPFDEAAGISISAVVRRLCLPAATVDGLRAIGVENMTDLAACEEEDLIAVLPPEAVEPLLLVLESRDFGLGGGETGEGDLPKLEAARAKVTAREARENERARALRARAAAKAKAQEQIDALRKAEARATAAAATAAAGGIVAASGGVAASGSGKASPSKAAGKQAATPAKSGKGSTRQGAAAAPAAPGSAAAGTIVVTSGTDRSLGEPSVGSAAASEAKGTEDTVGAVDSIVLTEPNERGPPVPSARVLQMAFDFALCSRVAARK